MSRELTTKEKIHILRNASLNTAMQLAVKLQCPLSLVTVYLKEADIKVKKERSSADAMNACVREYTFNRLRQKKHEF